MKPDEPILSFADQQKLIERKNQFYLDLAKSVQPGTGKGRTGGSPAASTRTARSKSRGKSR